MTERHDPDDIHTDSGSSSTPPVPPGPQRRDVLRRLFARTAAGSAILPPAAWPRPLVESVMLPAHAQTTGTSDEPDDEAGNDPPGPCVWGQEIVISDSDTYEVPSGAVSVSIIAAGGQGGGGGGGAASQ